MRLRHPELLYTIVIVACILMYVIFHTARQQSVRQDWVDEQIHLQAEGATWK